MATRTIETQALGISPEWLARVDAKVAEIMEATQFDPSHRWWAWQLVALIECGKAKYTHYQDNGITCEGWSYKSDIYTAYEGARRLEPHFWHGWALYSVWMNEPAAREQQFEANRSTYGTYDLYWENEETVAGWQCYQSFVNHMDDTANEVEARVYAAQVLRRPTTRRVRVGKTVMRNWRVWVDATRKVSDCEAGHTGRVPAVKHVTIETYEC
jgi:hypothetical protein